jgi:hypothetical protein
VEQMLEGFASFHRPVMIALSGLDLTAREYEDLCTADSRWAAAMRRQNVSLLKIDNADHTFSQSGGASILVEQIVSWLPRVGSSQSQEIQLPGSGAGGSASHN